MKRRSKPREIILEELCRLDTHPRADELFAIVRQRLPGISMGTVYRNLELFRRQGQVLEIPCGNFNRYDGDTSPHRHFLCRSCGRLWDFGMEPPLQIEREKTREGFEVDGRFTIFYGLCRECRGERG